MHSVTSAKKLTVIPQRKALSHHPNLNKWNQIQDQLKFQAVLLFTFIVVLQRITLHNVLFCPFDLLGQRFSLPGAWADPRGGIGAIAPPKTNEITLFTMILYNSENSIRIKTWLPNITEIAPLTLRSGSAPDLGCICLSEEVHVLYSRNKLTSTHKNGVYLYSRKILKVLLKL